MKKHTLWKKHLAFMAALALAGGAFCANAGVPVPENRMMTAAAEETAAPEPANPVEEKKAARTIMLYLCGADLESIGGMASYNLRQILGADFGQEENVRVVVMTGGSNRWHLQSQYLYEPASDSAPPRISNAYNQIWEAKGNGSAENAGKLVLLDGDGISGDGENAKPADEEAMTDPKTLKAFINYAAESFPADRYDLILWDHGSGPAGGFGKDEHFKSSGMSFAEMMDALSDNAVTRDGGKFDFLDFDACRMSSVDMALVFADYADYCIVSPENEPGYGQFYTGWLGLLREQPDMDTFTLGRKIVDDTIAFYDDENSAGYGSQATLSVIDLQKLTDSGIADDLTAFDAVLKDELTVPDEYGVYQFYDELHTPKYTIDYADGHVYFDLGSLVGMMSVKQSEFKPSDDFYSVDSYTAYTGVSKKITEVLSDPDILYARSTEGYGTKEMVSFRVADEPQQNFDYMGTSGIYLPFVRADGSLSEYRKYFRRMDEVIAKLPDDSRSQFMKAHLESMNDYVIATETGKAIGCLTDACGIPKNEITYDTIKALWTGEFGNAGAAATQWKLVKFFIERYPGGEDAARAWLDALIAQQADEVNSSNNVSVQTITGFDPIYLVTVRDSRRRTIDSIDLTYRAELPAAESYLDQMEDQALADEAREQNAGGILLGSRAALIRFDQNMDFGSDFDDFLQMLYNLEFEETSIWGIDSIPDQWYAVKDAEGGLHVASVSGTETINTFALIQSEEGNGQLVELRFRDGRLAELYLFSEDQSTSRQIALHELTTEMALMPVNVIHDSDDNKVCVPISASTFTLSSQNYDQIEMVYTDVADISDIADTDGDGTALTERLVLTDIYGYQFDVSEHVAHPASVLTHVGLAEAEPAIYDGSPKTPVLRIGDKVLKEGVDYTSVNASDSDEFIEPGTYDLLIYGKGDYAEGKLLEFEILPAEDSDTGETDTGETDTGEADTGETDTGETVPQPVTPRSDSDTPRDTPDAAGQFADPETIGKMAKIDFEKKYGIAVEPEVEQNADGTLTVTLKDASGTVLDTYTIDDKTGIGRDAQGAPVELPQTGIDTRGSTSAVGGALAAIAAGFWMVHRGGRKKQDEL